MFDKADVTKDGTISFAEYQAMCDEYGVKLQAEDKNVIKAIADEDGEVPSTTSSFLSRSTRTTSSSTSSNPPC